MQEDFYIIFLKRVWFSKEPGTVILHAWCQTRSAYDGHGHDVQKPPSGRIWNSFGYGIHVYSLSSYVMVEMSFSSLFSC